MSFSTVDVGTSKVLMFVNVAPNFDNVNETLRFVIRYNECVVAVFVVAQ
jgi:hypothetical protein